MAYDTATTDDVESKIPDEQGGMWFLKDALNTNRLGFTLLELEPGEHGKEHDHTDQGQEEIYYVETGSVIVDAAGDTIELTEGDAIRVASDTTRQIRNTGDQRARLVLVGAPAR